MSHHENFEQVSQIYEKSHIADGADFMWNVIIGTLKKDPSQVKLLDVGCGIGDYCLEFLKNGLQNLILVDASAGMLEMARQKTQSYGEYVTLKQMVLPELSFPDNSFDVVSFIQVLHHIDEPDTSRKTPLCKEHYPNVISSLQKAYHTLKEGGILIIDEMFEENSASFWLTSFGLEAYHLIKQLRIPKCVLIEILEEIHFKKLRVVTYPSGRIIKHDSCKQQHEIDNLHCHLSQHKQMEKHGELQSDGTLEELSEEMEEKLKIYGEHTTIFAFK